MKQKHSEYTRINTNKSTHSAMDPCSATKPNPENCKNCSSKWAYDCAQQAYTIQHGAVLIIFPLNLQTSITAQILSTGGEGETTQVSDSKLAGRPILPIRFISYTVYKRYHVWVYHRTTAVCLMWKNISDKLCDVTVTSAVTVLIFLFAVSLVGFVEKA